MRQGDVEADGRRAAFERPAIGRFHDPGAAARCNHIIPQRTGSGQGAAAHGHNAGEGARILIKAGPIKRLLRGALFRRAARLLRQGRGFLRAWRSGRTENHHGGTHPPIAQLIFGLGVFHAEAERAHFIAQQEFLILHSQQIAA